VGIRQAVRHGPARASNGKVPLTDRRLDPFIILSNKALEVATKTKKCSRCKTIKSIEEFTRRSRSKDGYRSYCRECSKKDAQRWRADSKALRAAYEKDYYAENRERILQRQKRWREENPEKSKKATRRWASANKELIAEKRARRRASKRQATPPWLTNEHREQMEAIYARCFEAEELTGIKHHVDHIHPLVHPLLCGLHVPWNLQVITAEENLRKGNRIEIGLEV
jgi:hypothetical protein